jgi:peptide/nickel transport system substrate-binding protein
MEGVSKAVWAAVAIVIVLVVVAAAIAMQKPAAPPPPPTNVTVPKKIPVTLSLPLKDDIVALNPLNPDTSTVWNAYVFWLVEPSVPILTLNPNWSDFVGWAADNWTIVAENGKTVFTVHLRPGMSWSDGKPITADDYMFTLSYVIEKELAPTWKDMYEKSIKVDNLTVKIYLKDLYPLDYFWAYIPNILPKHVYEKVDDPVHWEPNVSTYVGAGPYKLVNWVKGQYVELEKKDNWWGTKIWNGPVVDKIILRVIKTDDAILLALKKKDIAADTWPVPPASLTMVNSLPYIKTIVKADPGFFYLAFNLRKKPMSDIAFRKAIAYCTPKQDIVKSLLMGQGYPMPSAPLSQFYAEHGYLAPDLPVYEFNTTKAKEVLEKAGYKLGKDGWFEMPDGTPIKVTILTPSYDPVRVRAGEMIAANARSIGLNVESKAVDFNAIVAAVWPPEGAPTFDMYILGWGITGTEPFWLRDFFHSSQIVEITKGMGSNSPGYNNSKFDKIIDEVTKTLNKEERKKLFYEAEKLLAEDLPYIGLYSRAASYAYNIEDWTNWCAEWQNGPAGWDNIWTFLHISKKG